jgi:hypothetical protein
VKLGIWLLFAAVAGLAARSAVLGKGLWWLLLLLGALAAYMAGVSPCRVSGPHGEEGGMSMECWSDDFMLLLATRMGVRSKYWDITLLYRLSSPSPLVGEGWDGGEKPPGVRGRSSAAPPP